MSNRRIERLVNLTIALLAAEHPLTVEEIGARVAGYTPGDDPAAATAFRRMFERDKEDLRELGLPVRTATAPDGSPGYLLPRSVAHLPDVHLAAPEAVAVALAARMFTVAGLREPARRGLGKLVASGLPSADPVAALQLGPTPGDAGLEAFLTALRTRRAVAFDYAGGSEPARRHLQVWGVLSWRGRWYTGGLDTDRGEQRVFRLSRVRGPVVFDGPAGAVSLPADVDLARRLQERVAALAESEPGGTATVLVQAGRAQRWRARALEVTAIPDRDLERLIVPYDDESAFVAEACRAGPQAVVVSPPRVRARVLAALAALLEAHP